MLCLLTRVATVQIDDEINRMVNTQGDCSKVCYSDKNKQVHAIDQIKNECLFIKEFFSCAVIFISLIIVAKLCVFASGCQACLWHRSDIISEQRTHCKSNKVKISGAICSKTSAYSLGIQRSIFFSFLFWEIYCIRRGESTQKYLDHPSMTQDDKFRYRKNTEKGSSTPMVKSAIISIELHVWRGNQLDSNDFVSTTTKDLPVSNLWTCSANALTRS